MSSSTSKAFFSDTYVEETRFGFWFLRSHTWQHHVLRVAINDLRRLFDGNPPAAPVLLDVGCGQGKSFRHLHQVFAPSRLLGTDADPHSLALSAAEAERLGISEDTVKTHRKNLYAKLDIATQVELFSLFIASLAQAQEGLSKDPLESYLRRR